MTFLWTRCHSQLWTTQYALIGIWNLGPLDLQSNTLPLCHGGCWHLVLITLVGLFNDSFAISRTAYLLPLISSCPDGVIHIGAPSLSYPQWPPGKYLTKTSGGLYSSNILSISHFFLHSWFWRYYIIYITNLSSFLCPFWIFEFTTY